MTLTSKVSLLRHTVQVSITEGVYTQVYILLATAGSAFITRFALLLGARPFQLGFLSAIGQFSLVFQPFGFALTRRGLSRKRIIVKLGTAGRALALLYGLLPFFFPQYIAIWVFLLLLSISNSLHAMSTNAWIAWISDMVPERLRGRFFSWRSRYYMIVGLFVGYLLGGLVDLFDPNTVGLVERIIGIEKVGFFAPEYMNVVFICVFVVAAIFGFMGIAVLKKQPERPKRVEHERLSRIFLDSLRDQNFRKFLTYNIWWMLAIGIGSPFWQPFMIQKLRMSLVNIQVYGTISAVASILALRPWGMIIDRFGNKAAMRIAIVMGGINPLVWLFVNAQSYGIVYLEAITSGIMWSGANIVAMNFVLAIAPEGKRQIYSGVLGVFSGFAMMISMLLSGFLLPGSVELLGLHLEPEQVLFGLTGLMRWTANIPLSWVKEAKAQPFGALLYFFRQSAKVRITQLFGSITRNGSDRPRGDRKSRK